MTRKIDSQELASRLNITRRGFLKTSAAATGGLVIAFHVPGARRLAAAGLTAEAIQGAARAIMTTDTFPKGAAQEVTISGKTVRITGIAKGSGMIAPDMATMLVYIFTDAACDQSVLQALLGRLNAHTFNCITVDSDTSTSAKFRFRHSTDALGVSTRPLSPGSGRFSTGGTWVS